MGRHKSKLSTLSIFRWFCNNVAIVLGIIPQSRRHRRTLTKRLNRRVNITRPNKSIKKYRRRKCSQINEIEMYQNMNSKANAEFNNICRVSGASEILILNNNNNRSLDKLKYDDINVNRLSDVDQHQRIICILVGNQKRAECIQHLLAEHGSIFKDSRIIDLQELVQFIQSTTTNITHEDASTMTNTDQMFCQTTSCTSFITQSENARRLKALEFIRIFIENNKEDFFKYLINEEHLCQQKTLAIYQIIKQFLKIVYQSEHVQKENSS